MSKEDKVMRNTNYKQAGWIAIAIAALAGWLLGYYVRWNPETRRPYIERREMPGRGNGPEEAPVAGNN